MGETHDTSTNTTILRVSIGVMLAGALGGLLALGISQLGEGPQEWTQCFDDFETAVTVGSDAGSALTSVRAERGENQRQLEAHVRALEQLEVDGRWADPEQQPWLEVASDQTRARIAELRGSDAAAGDTEGCLEQF